MLKTKKGNFRSVAVITADDSGNIPTEIQILPVGEWNTEKYGPMTVTLSHIDEMCQNFDKNVRKAVPIDVDHDGGKACGWIQSLVNKGADGLWAVVEWNKYGLELLQDKIYKLFSPEFAFNYVDPEYGTRHGAVLVAGSLVNRPLFKELDFIVASESGKGGQLTIVCSEENMLIEDILKKQKDELSQEELAFLKEHQAELTAEQVEQFGLGAVTEEAKKEDTKEGEGEQTKEEKEAAEKAKTEEAEKARVEAEEAEKARVEAEKAKIEADEKKAKDEVTIKAKELEELQVKAREYEALTQKIAATEFIKPFVANDKGGKILPKDKDAVINFYLTCSDSQKLAFADILKNMPEIKIAGEVGDEEVTVTLTANDEIDKLIVELQKQSPSMTRAQALSKVSSSNPDLMKRYNQELTGRKG